MDLLLIIFVVAVVLALVLVCALGVVAKSADGGSQEAGWLTSLVALRSPSGKPFFASRGALRDFVDVLDEVDDGDEPGGSSAPRHQPPPAAATPPPAR